MAAYPGYIYKLHIPDTAITTSKTLMQLAMGTAAPAEILEIVLGQTNRVPTTSEMWELQLLRKSAAATVTAAVSGTTVFPLAQDDPAASTTNYLVLSTTGTGYNATAEGTDGLIQDGPWNWNILTAMFVWTYNVPELRPQLRASDIMALKLLTTPGASTTVSGYIKFAIKR